MSEELTLESLGLEKPLEKMTAKELREMIIEKLPMIQGASGMDKDALVKAVKDVLGIVDPEPTPAENAKAEIADLKKTMRQLKTDKAGIADAKKREILRKKIGKLKKRTRKLAKAA